MSHNPSDMIQLRMNMAPALPSEEDLHVLRTFDETCPELSFSKFERPSLQTLFEYKHTDSQPNPATSRPKSAPFKPGEAKMQSSFKCRVILVKASPSLRANFSGSFKESETKTLVLYHESPEIFAIIAKSIYAGELRMPDEVNDIILTPKQYSYVG